SGKNQVQFFRLFAVERGERLLDALEHRPGAEPPENFTGPAQFFARARVTAGIAVGDGNGSEVIAGDGLLILVGDHLKDRDRLTEVMTRGFNAPGAGAHQSVQEAEVP